MDAQSSKTNLEALSPSAYVGTTSILDEFRKDLPVDVLEEDGIFTRAYLQAVLENGDFSAYFDCNENAVRIVRAEDVYEAPWLNYWDTDRLFHDGSQFYWLLRYAVDESERWYPATIVKANFHSVLTVSFPNGYGRKGFIDGNPNPSPWLNRQSSLALTNRGKPSSLLVDFPVVLELEQAVDRYDGFLEAFGRYMNCLIAEWEDRRATRAKPAKKSLTLLMPCVAAVKSEAEAVLRNGVSDELVRAISGVLTRTPKRKSEMSERETGAKRPRLSEFEALDQYEPRSKSKGDMAEENAHIVFHIPELVNRILHFMDIQQRHSLRSVCKLWHEELNSRSVKRLARLDVSAPEPAESHDEKHSVERLNIFFRSMNFHLETFVICFDLSRQKKDYHPDDCADYQRWFPCLLSALAMLPRPALRKVVFSGGYMTQQLLSRLLCLERPVPVVLRNMRIKQPGVRYHIFGRETLFDVYVEAGQVGGSELLPNDRREVKDKNKSVKYLVEAYDTVAKFLAVFLDSKSLSAEEVEAVRVEIVRNMTGVGISRVYLEYVLKTLDPQFLEDKSEFPDPQIYPSSDDDDPLLHGASLRSVFQDLRKLDLAALRPSTLRHFIVGLGLYPPDECFRDRGWYASYQIGDAQAAPPPA